MLLLCAECAGSEAVLGTLRNWPTGNREVQLLERNLRIGSNASVKILRLAWAWLADAGGRSVYLKLPAAQIAVGTLMCHWVQGVSLQWQEVNCTAPPHRVFWTKGNTHMGVRRME